MHVFIENNENLGVCKQCGGKCCKHCACEVSTEDFVKRYGEITPENILKALSEGEWAIDWWEGDIREDYEDMGLPERTEENTVWESYYMRVRHVGESAVQGSWGGQCVMWDPETGCKYDWEHRPTGGKDMAVGSAVCPVHYHDIPEPKYGKDMAAVDWFPYHDVVDKAIDMKRDKDKILELQGKIDCLTDDILCRQRIVQRGCTRAEALKNLARVTEDRKEIVRLREKMRKYK